MALRTVLESLDGLDEALVGLYTEKEGKFILDLEGIDDHPRVRGLVTANKENVRKRDEWKSRAEAAEAKVADLPEDFDVEEYARLKADADPSKAGDKNEHLQKQKEIYEQRIAALRTTAATEKAALEAQIAQLEADFSHILIDGGLTSALVEKGIDPDFLDGAKALLQRSVKIVKDENGTRRAIVETDLGEEPIDQFVGNWMQSDKGKKYRAKADGGDAPGTGQRRMDENPFDTKGGTVKPNMTALQDYILKNPEKARAQAKAAGHPVNW